MRDFFKLIEMCFWFSMCLWLPIVGIPVCWKKYVTQEDLNKSGFGV